MTHLVRVQEDAWNAMKGVYKALWPEEQHVPDDTTVLGECL